MHEREHDSEITAVNPKTSDCFALGEFWKRFGHLTLQIALCLLMTSCKVERASNIDILPSNPQNVPGEAVLIAGGLGSAAAISTAQLLIPADKGLVKAGNMGQARYRSAAATLADGTVLVTGGIDDSGRVLSSSEIYDPVVRKFHPTQGSMLHPRWAHTATRLADGRVLVVGGFGARGAATESEQIQHKMVTVHGEQPLSSAELFDPRTSSFTDAGETFVPRVTHTATLLSSGQVLVTGGNSGQPLPDAELYLPSRHAFRSSQPMIALRYNHTSIVLDDGRVLIAGGRDGNGNALASAELYDPRTGTFTATASMNEVRQGHTAVRLDDGSVLIAGGFGAQGTMLNSTEIYDPRTANFQRAGPMTQSGPLTLTLLQDGRAIAAGSFGLVELFDPKSRSFVPIAHIAEGGGHIAADVVW